MLPWSEGKRRTRPRIGAGLLLGLVLAAASPVTAQQSAEAILLRGPEAVRGVPGYASNRIPAFRGQYGLGERVFEVLFTRESLYLPRAWPALRCGALELYQVPANEGLVLFFAGGQGERGGQVERGGQGERGGQVERGAPGFFLYFLFPENEPAESWCRFVQSFLERFVFLLGLTDSKSEVPFPAVLQLGR